MRIAVGQAARPTEEYLAFASQLGVKGVQFNTPDLPGEQRWELTDLVALRERVESRGLVLEAIENIPNHFYQKAMLGLQAVTRKSKTSSRPSATLAKLAYPCSGSTGWPTRFGVPTCCL